jgi:hypothetical protein
MYHFFDLESILAATDSFSDAKKLGQGGYGPVYKVILAALIGVGRGVQAVITGGYWLKPLTA